MQSVASVMLQQIENKTDPHAEEHIKNITGVAFAGTIPVVFISFHVG